MAMIYQLVTQACEQLVHSKQTDNINICMFNPLILM